MYASYKVKLDNYLRVQLNRGENFIFDPELLHATRINSSKHTRVAITLRVSPIEPVFSLNVNHDIYDEWISSENIKQGKLTPIRVHNRIEIEDYPETLPSNDINQVNLAPLTFDDLKNLQSLDRKTFEVEDEEIFQLLLKDGQYLGVWLNSEMFVFPSHCPHIGASLAMGAINNAEKAIKCPGHGLEFSLVNGASSCSNLKIKTQSIKVTGKLPT
jgi:nitrite reductase/ring-hydroxylating ferredoxin subunit